MSPLTRILAGTLALALTVVAASCGGSSSSSTAESRSPVAEPTPAATSSVPSNTVWLCRPGLADNPCESSLETTAVSADGTTAVEQAVGVADPPIDCFYVYPTVSGQKGPNATLDIDPEERAIAVNQAARFTQVCRVYAPMYRQLTLSAITSAGAATAANRALAYADVRSAWQDYLANYNQGRGVVLIGHSQGSMMLTQLVKAEIDPNPVARRLLVSALLIGGNVKVAAGTDVGGDFQNIPACSSADQTGCVVAYSSFNQPPPADSLFGRVRAGAPGGQAAPNTEVLCVNPASPAGGSGALLPYFPTAPFPGAIGAVSGKVTSVSTPWIAYPGLYTARCESAGGANWLQVDGTGGARDQRPLVQQTLGPTWGLHLYDVGLALGNLVDLVRQQAAAYTR